MIISVLRQTVKNWELLICFDNPPDKTILKKIIKKYNSTKKIKFFVSTKNKGVGPTRQFLFNKSKSPYIIPLDSDDYVDQNLLKEFAEKIKQKSDFSILRAGLKLISELMVIDIIPEPRQNYEGFTIDIYNIYQPYLINAKYFQQVGGWHWNPAVLNACEDADIFIRLETLAPIYIIPKILYFKRQHSNGLTAKMQGELGNNSLFYSINLMLKTRNLNNLRFIGYRTKNSDDKGIIFNFYLKYFNLYTHHSFKVITPLSVKVISPLIKTIEIIRIFGKKNQLWKKFFLYADNTLENQIAAPDIYQRVCSSKMPYHKKYQLYQLLQKYCGPFSIIDIILPVTQSYKITKKCINALFVNSGHFFNLIIINHLANDPQLKKYFEKLQQCLPNVEIINNTEQKGYLASINQVIKKTKGEYLVLVDNNTIVTVNWLNKLKEGFDCEKNIGIVGANFETENSPAKAKKYSSFLERNWLGSPCLLIKKVLLNKIGGYNQVFSTAGLYSQIDLCFRAQHNGYRILLAKECIVSHLKMALPSNEITKENIYAFHKIWATHQLFKTLPENLIFEQKTLETTHDKKNEPLVKPSSCKTKIAAVAIEKYANISHRITDQDNIEYLQKYFDLVLIPEYRLHASLIDFFNYLSTENIYFVFINTTFDPYPLFSYRNEHNLQVGFIVWPYIFEPWQERYFRLSKMVQAQDTFLVFSNYLKRGFQQISLNFDLLEMAGPIDHQKFTNNCLEQTSLKLVYCGRLTPLKNLHILISLLGSSKGLLNFNLEIICPLENLHPAEKKYLELLNQTIKRFNLQKNITFHGDLGNDQKQRNKILGESNVLLFLSTDNGETFGRAIVEGMAAGCAIVTTNWQAVNELVRDGENGFLIDIVNNTPVLKQLLNALLLLSDFKIRKAIQLQNLREAKKYDYHLQIPKLATRLAEKSPSQKETISEKYKWPEEIPVEEISKYVNKHHLEFAVAIQNIKELDKFKELNYKYLYFGSEFCENLIPSPEELKEIINLCLNKNKILVLLTPLLTNSGVEKITKLLPLLPRNCEVVLNDWGLVKHIKNCRLKPRLGRLLIKAKREPLRNTHNTDHFKPYLMTTNLEEQGIQEFLLNQKITALELDNLWQGYNVSFSTKFKNSLYFPYVYITITKKCLSQKQNNCLLSCQQEYLTAKLRKCPNQILIRGNTQFYLNRKLPGENVLKNLQIKRLIYFH